MGALCAGAVPGSHILSSCSFLWPPLVDKLGHKRKKKLCCAAFMCLIEIVNFVITLKSLIKKKTYEKNNDQQKKKPTAFVKLKGQSSGGCRSGQFYLECLVLYDGARKNAALFTQAHVP